MLHQPVTAPVADLPRCRRLVCGENVQAVGAGLHLRTAVGRESKVAGEATVSSPPP